MNSCQVGFVMMLRLLRQLIRSLLLLCLCCLCLLGQATPSTASTHVYPEAADRVMVRSLQTLRDRSGQAWQVVFYKRLSQGQVDSVRLRLVGFPDQAAIDHSQPLAFELGLADVWTSPDVTPAEFAPAVGEYDVRAVMEQVDSAAPLHLVLPLRSGTAELLVPPFAVREWQEVMQWQPS
ncbi:MAG: DUF3122 domain-containing protein [Leptolyngbyaceae cyanobacterium SL_7_1]|nr:DUF3122 domain-containing protein [Leptolyngbyaceae cyanobacterium SL_7_1]